MSLDIGSLIGRVVLDDVTFQRTYVRLVRQFGELGAKASAAAGGTERLDTSLSEAAAAGNAAAAGLGHAEKAMTGAGASASTAAVATKGLRDATTEQGLAASRLTQATLRQQAAQARLDELQSTGKATSRQLAGAQASLIAANDRVALSQERVASSMVLGARSADAMRTTWQRIPAPVKTAAAVIGVAAFEAVKAASDYQKLTVNLVTGAGESQRALGMVSDGILHLAGQVGFGADTLAKAMFLVESAGFHGAAALTLLRTAAKGAKVDNADLTIVVDALTSAMNAYHEPATQAARVTNTLIASAAVGKMHLQDLAASLGTVLPSAAALRVPLDQVGAALATMTMQGTDASRAATYLRFAFAALANPTSKAQAAMQAVGITSQAVADTMTHGGLPAVFTLLEDAVGRKFPAGSAKYLASLANMVGGTRGLQAVLELTGRNLSTMNGNLASIDGRVNSAGNSVSDWADVQKNLNVQWSMFIDGLGAAGIHLGQDLIPALTSTLHVLNSTGHVASEVAGFFEHDRTAADALAAILLVSLEPAFAKLGVAVAGLARAGGLALLGRLGAASASMRGLGIAGLAGKAGVAAFVFEALNAIGDINHLNDTVNALRSSMSKPLQGDLLGDLNAEQQRLFASMSDNVIKNMSAWQAFSTGLMHPVNAIKLIAGSGDDQIKNMSATIDQAYGNFHSLVLALHGFPTPDAETQTSMALKAMGISARDLGGTAFPALLARVQEWIGSNQDAKAPMEQSHALIVALGSGALSAADDVKALTAALNLMAGDSLSADQATIAFHNDIAALDKALHKSRGSLSLTSQAGRDARDAFDSAAQQALNVAEAQAKLKGGTDRARATLRAEIKTLRDHAGGSDYAKAAINRLRDALGNLPPSVQTAMKALAKAAGEAKTSGDKVGLSFAQGVAQGMDEGLPGAEKQAIILARQAAAAARSQKGFHSNSPSRVGHAIGLEFGQGVADGIAASSSHAAAAAVRMANAAITATQNQLQTLHGNATSMSSGVSSGISGTFGLANAPDVSAKGMTSFLAYGAKASAQFDSLERRLIKAGLSPALVQQLEGIFESDPGKGLAAARNVLASGAGGIHRLDRLETSIDRSAARTGKALSNQQYGAGIDRLVHKLGDLESEMRKLRGDVSNIAHEARLEQHKSTVRSGKK